MPTFGSVSGRHLSRKALKSRHSTRSCHEKVKKTLYRSTTRVTKYGKTYLKRAKTIPSADPGASADPGYPSHGLRHGTTPTRAGGQDDVSSNKLPQNIFRIILTESEPVATLGDPIRANFHVCEAPRRGLDRMFLNTDAKTK